MRPKHVLPAGERAPIRSPRRHAEAPSSAAFIVSFAALAFASACASRHRNEDPASAREAAWTSERVEDLYECRLTAPSWYRSAWYSFFDDSNVLARKLVGAHMRCGAEPLTLGPDDVADLAPEFDFEAVAADVDDAARARSHVAFEVPAHAPGASLGRFTARFEGSFLPSPAGGDRFEGLVRYEDSWNLEDVHPALARIALPGKSVPVRSLPVRVTLLRRKLGSGVLTSSQTATAAGGAAAPAGAGVSSVDAAPTGASATEAATGTSSQGSRWEWRLHDMREPKPLAFSPRLLTLASQVPELAADDASNAAPGTSTRGGSAAIPGAGTPAASLGAAAAKKKPLARARSFEIIRKLESPRLIEPLSPQAP